MLPPRLGWLSGLSLTALAVFQLAAIPGEDPTLSHFASQVWLAWVWAGWSAAVWILAGPPYALGRVAGLAGLLAWHCGIMYLAREQALERYVIMFAGFGVLQATAGVLLRLPRWSWGKSGAPRQGQFGILSLLVLMSSVALVSWATRRYGDAGGEYFLQGAVLILLLLAAVAAHAIAATTARASYGKALLTVLMILSAAASAVAMAWLETIAREGGDVLEFWNSYFTINATFALTLYALGHCGQLDAEREKQRSGDRS
ncbi:hypothetical protein [Candidatus Laterigemmans baculatus]|nr:hypothetical protein [Candidatus Laterigemmans baculatus]